MINVLLSGVCGKMGKNVVACLDNDKDAKIVCGVDIADEYCSFPVYHSFDDVTSIPDVIIDFSNVVVLDKLLKFAISNKVPAVLAVTGYDEKQIATIKKASKLIPIFFTANMSLGVNLLCSLVKKAAAVLADDFDIEIIEKHHNQKLDSPSGTAIMLANSVNDIFNDRFTYEYDRHSKRAKRTQSEIGIHSVRGGTIVGEHDVIFAGRDEVITLSHSATSKEVFAIGAIKAAKFIFDKEPGLYDMNDILNLK